MKKHIKFYCNSLEKYAGIFFKSFNQNKVVSLYKQVKTISHINVISTIKSLNL